MYRSKRNTVVKRLGASSAVMLAVAAAGIGVAAASTHAFSSNPNAASARISAATLASHDQSSTGTVEGTVSAVTASAITLTTSSGSVIFSLNSSTSVTNKSAIGAISDLSVGEEVTITPSPSDATLAATIVISSSTSVPGDTLAPVEGTVSGVTTPSTNDNNQGDDNNQGVGLALGEDSHGDNHGGDNNQGVGLALGHDSQGADQGGVGLGVAANATAGLDN